MQTKKGLFVAAIDPTTHYSRQAWIRDNFYIALGLEATGNWNEVLKTYHAWLDVFKKHEYKIDWAIKKKPEHKHEYIHARINPETLEEYHEEWGNMQNDAVGALLFKIGELEQKNIKVLRDKDDRRIIQKLVNYLESVEYWHDCDNGIWEDDEEVHASSVGACVAGLKKVKEANIADVHDELIEKGQITLNHLLPRESVRKDTDLALLSLIYPFDVVSEEQKLAILRDVETKLIRKNGVIRNVGDWYYNRDGEAEWTFGFPWLAIIYKQMGATEQYLQYLKKTISVMNEDGELPELYYAGSDEHNENTPLGWGQSLAIVAVLM